MAEVAIYEDKHDFVYKYENVADLMTKEEHAKGIYYRQKYFDRRGELDFYKEEWDDLMRMYQCERDPDPDDEDYPNSFIPLITPVVEGQVASMMEEDIDYQYISRNPMHQNYMSKLELASQYFRTWNQCARHFKDFTRWYEVLGGAWVTVMWEKSFSNDPRQPNGYPRIMIPTLLSVLVDGRIKDHKDLQHAEYIIHEIGFQDIAWAREEYGNDKAESLARLMNRYEGRDTEALIDDSYSFMLLHVWTRNNPKHNLQLIEMDANGFILRISDPDKPYYKNVDNEYPFYFARMIPRLGRFYGYGDGKILKPMQICVNRLTDELEIGARNNAQPKTFVDEKADMDMEQWDSDPSHPIMATNPHQNIMVQPGVGVNQVVMDFIQFLLSQAQRTTRFADIMTGNQQGVSATATQIYGQLNQGSVGIKDKKADISSAMAWTDRYSLNLALEFCKVPFWSSLDGEKFEFIDAEEIAMRPAAIPPTADTMIKYIDGSATNREAKMPKYEMLEENGVPVMIRVAFDVRVILSSGFPMNKNAQYNQILGLLQLQIVNPQTGAPELFIDPDIARKKMEQILGYKLTSEEWEGISRNYPQPAQAQPGYAPSQMNPLPEGNEVALPQGANIRMPPTMAMATTPYAANKDNRGQI